MIDKIKNKNACRKKCFSNKALLSLFIFLFSFTGFSQVKAVLDTTSIKIGEEIKYAIEVLADSSSTVLFPEGQTFLPLEVIEFYATDTIYQDDKTRLIKKYGLTQFDSGRYVIPQQQVRINDQAFYTDTLLVEVADVVVDTLKQKMFDIKPAIDVPPVKTDWLKYSLWILLILAVLAALMYFIMRQKKKTEESKRQLPPFEEALVALKTLDTSDYLRENRIKDYYSSLTEIVKRYLDREVDEAALESTTDELITKLEMHKDAGHLEFDKATIHHLKEILKRADLIKFAKMQMESGQAQLDRTDIEEIIKETHDSIPEPSEEEKLKDALYQEQLLKKKKKKKKVLIIGSIASALIVGLAIVTLIFGVNEVKDTIFGNYTRSLVEGNWIKSEYGSPAVILESPEVLVRKTAQDEFVITKDLDDIFTFGDIQKKIYVYVGAQKVQKSTQINLEEILEEKLVLMEEAGATNLIVMDEPFTTEKGIVGVKATGEFNIQIGENKFKKAKSEYELIIFAQQGSIQEILIVVEKDDFYAQQIKERLLNSVEIEVKQQ
jgi:flagellar basal body-associated protein FliL